MLNVLHPWRVTVTPTRAAVTAPAVVVLSLVIQPGREGRTVAESFQGTGRRSGHAGGPTGSNLGCDCPGKVGSGCLA